MTVRGSYVEASVDLLRDRVHYTPNKQNSLVFDISIAVAQG